MPTSPYFISKIRERFETKKTKNSRFSLRQYAASLDINSGTLSAIMAGKRSLPQHQIVNVAKKMSLTEEEKQKFFESLDHPVLGIEDAIEVGAETHYDLHDSWEHSVVLFLFRNKNYGASLESIREKTAIPQEKIQSILTGLIEQQILEMGTDGLVRCKGKNIRINQNWAAEESRRDQINNLKLSLENIERVTADNSGFSYQTISIDRKKLTLLRRKIKKFWSEVAELSDTDNTGHLYRVSICLFPVTEK